MTNGPDPQPQVRSVGIVLHDLPLGGTERIALRLARAWRDRGVAVTLFCGDPAGPLAALVPDGVTLVPADPRIPRAHGSRRRLGAVAAAHFARAPVDALFVPGNYHWDTVPALGRVGVPILVQISSPLTMPQRGPLAQALFERRMRRTLAQATALVAMDQSGRAEADRILGRAIATVIPLPAIDDDAPAPLAPPSGPYIVAAGRLIPQKGFDVLIDALALVADPAVRLSIAGTGPEQRRLRRRIARRGLDARVALLGYVPDIRPCLDAARLFVLPSRFEGYGAVILEALAAGRPVVATAVTPAVDDLIAGTDRGLAVPPDDPVALARAIETVLGRAAPDPASLAAAVAPWRLERGAAAYLALLARCR